MKLGLIVIAMRQHGPHIAKILARQAIAEAQHLHARTGVVGLRHRGARSAATRRACSRAPTRSRGWGGWA